MLATILPIAAGIIAVNVLGYKNYRDAEGQRFQGQAEQMSDFLSLRVDKAVRNLHDWLTLRDFSKQLNEINLQTPPDADDAFIRHILEMEELCPDLDEADPVLTPFLEIDLARDLRRFQAINPTFSEIFVTDAFGRLVASTNKTTDYWQANEHWWQKGRQASFQSAHIEGINFDASAEVYSFDLAIPIRDPEDPEGPPAGVAKAVLQASDLFFDLARRVSPENVRWKCILEDGRILFARDREPLENRITPEAASQFSASGKGWMTGDLTTGEKSMLGFTRLPWEAARLDADPDPPSPEILRRQIAAHATSDLTRDVLEKETETLLVLVHAPAKEVLAPVRAQLRNITLAGIFFILLSTATGFLIARNELIRPIRTLQSAARNIASTARLTDQHSVRAAPVQAIPVSTRRALERIGTIRSSDELGELSRDFEAMANRVLQYNEQLKADLQAQTREIQRELDLAREFQEALMPRAYPTIPAQRNAGGLRLSFHHIYLPTSTVGGDFFNVIKLGEDRAGIFIADVMGHGARSALITAIIGTLLQDFAYTIDDPGRLMGMMNENFLHIMRHCNDFVFVSAFYMVVDTGRREVFHTSAGHPAPLVANRNTRQVAPLYPSRSNGSALGLMANSVYTRARQPIEDGTRFFLFTDGIIEAVNSAHDEFGLERLETVIRDNLDARIATLSETVLKSVIDFTGRSSFADDICFVAMEAENDPRRSTPARADSGAGRSH